MPINVLPKNTPRGRGPEPTRASGETQNMQIVDGEEVLQEKEAELADQEIQALWESQEIGHSSWSGEAGNRYSDPE